MSILYALIARKKAVLAEYSSSSGNFPTVTRVLLGKIPETDSKMSYVYDKYVFHYIVSQGITFLCMSDENAKRRVTFAYLEDIMKNWRDRFGSTEQTALAFSLNDIFSPVLRQRMVSSDGALIIAFYLVAGVFQHKSKCRSNSSCPESD